MYAIVLCILLVIVVLVVSSIVEILKYTHVITERMPLYRFDNSNVPLIQPPAEITVEGNSHECHKNLTPCNTHMDCDLCREGLANCQYFDEKTILTMRNDNGDEVEHVIEPGQSYCLALDRERARSCNPNTGVWILAESAVGFTLLCSCLSPGLVTQFNMYEDCNVQVGCQPHGQIASVNESPLRCVCDDGYVADFDSVTQTPFCRPMTIRDVRYDTNFFPRAPCEDGFVRLDHPGLDQMYRREFNMGDICVVDPCSVDPISGQRTAGRLVHYNNPSANIEYNYCTCPIASNLFSVYSPTPSMIANSSVPVSNACIQPFNTNIFNVRRLDYKFFWAQPDATRSDDDVIATVDPNQLSHIKYRQATYPFLTTHPDLTNLNGSFVLLKFSTAFTPLHLFASPQIVNARSLYQRYHNLAAQTSAPCFFPGVGRCITANYDDCIRRHAAGQVWTAETFTNSWCVLSRENEALQIWSPATRYPTGQFPMALRVNVLFAISEHNRAFTTVHAVYGGTATSGANVDNLANIMNTYRNYSVN
uniref:Putative 59.7 kDa protein n=1 Tax=Ectropis obliqua nucleopolyhedrovirus TaxID=59376 RepID=S5TRH5_9ABAC|nr:putative 59.7 kDa protein [Ectropis obliqua nucleopolyhedrovirus]